MDLPVIAIIAIAAFVAGLLVGRRNPSVASAAAAVANDAKDAVKKI